MPRRGYVCAVTLLVLIAFRPSSAAKSADLVKLTNCLYIAAKYNDGDSFRVRCGTDEFNLRLYFVDAPETNLCSEQAGEQSKYFGVTRDDVMNAGARAGDIVQEMLRTPFVVWTRWASAGGRGTRYFALVEMGDKSLVEVLVSQGLARTKGLLTTLPTGEKAGEYAKKLKMLERDAQQGKRGIWATSTVGLTPQAAVPLVGAWERISLKNVQCVVTESAAPAAFLIFSANGYFSQTVIPTGRNKINKPTQDMTKEELVNRLEQLLASRGTYTVSGKKLVRKDISHSDPNLEGSEQVQEFRIEGDILILTTPASNAEARFQRLK